MASEKMITANRRNAKKSTGPKSRRGKEIARMNALKHGLRAESIIIPGENSEEFDVLYQCLKVHYQPIGPAETFQFERIVHCTWRLNRLCLIETAILRKAHSDYEVERATEELRRAKGDHDEIFVNYMRFAVADPGEDEFPDQVSDTEDVDHTDPLEDAEAKEVKAQKAYREARKMADAFSRDSASSLAIAFLGSTRDLETLSRFETTMERRLRNAVRDLERLQAARVSAAADNATIIDVPDAVQVSATVEASQGNQGADPRRSLGEAPAPRRRKRG